jgi:ectoine hydroxylase-related dioxygenase (phytanoyl-CoA dioxygenase family)
MDHLEMSNEENYAFDVSGYLVLKGVLKPEEIERMNSAIDDQGEYTDVLTWAGGRREPFRDLLVHPVLVQYLNQICGTGFRLDSLPRIFSDDPTSNTPFSDRFLPKGDEPRNQGATYFQQNDRRQCQMVRVLWALSDIPDRSGGPTVVPCTHKSNVATPDDLLDGTDDMGLAKQLVLEEGDIVIIADAVVRGLRPWRGDARLRLLEYTFTARGVIAKAGTGPETEKDPYPDWMEELDDASKAVLHLPGYQSSTPPQALIPNGQKTDVAEHRDLIHPSILKRDHDADIDYKEFYYWDLCGHLVIRNIMSEEDLALANEAVDKFGDQIVRGEELSRGSKSLAGAGRPILPRLLELPKPYCEPFRRMVAHPEIVKRLTWMGGSGFRCGQPQGFVSDKGSTGHSLHDANEPLLPSRSYVYKNGRSHCEAVTVTWQLRDVSEDEGGFACVPGSHKARYRLPRGVSSCDDHMDLVAHPTFKAGDVVFFMDGAQTHGALAWHSELARRGILIKYSSRSFNRSGGEMCHPENRWGDVVDGMTDAQLAVMRGPDRDNHNGNVPRLDITDGEVAVDYERSGGLYSGATPDKPLAAGNSS